MAIEPTYYARFPVTLLEPALAAASVQWEAVPDTAVAGTDYVASSGTVNFAAGEQYKWVDVPVANTSNNVRRWFSCRLFNPVGCSLLRSQAKAILGLGPFVPLFLDDFDSGPSVLQGRLPFIGGAWQDDTVATPKPTVSAGKLQVATAVASVSEFSASFKDVRPDNGMLMMALNMSNVVAASGQTSRFVLEVYDYDGVASRKVIVDLTNNRLYMMAEDSLLLAHRSVELSAALTNLFLYWNLITGETTVFTSAAGDKSGVFAVPGGPIPNSLPNRIRIVGEHLTSAAIDVAQLTVYPTSPPSIPVDATVIEEFSGASGNLAGRHVTNGLGAWGNGVIPAIKQQVANGRVSFVPSSGNQVGSSLPIGDDFASLTNAQALRLTVPLLKGALPTTGSLRLSLDSAVSSGAPLSGAILEINFASNSFALHGPGLLGSLQPLPSGWRDFEYLEVSLQLQPRGSLAFAYLNDQVLDSRAVSASLDYATLILSMEGISVSTLQLDRLFIRTTTPEPVQMSAAFPNNALDVMLQPGDPDR